MKKILFIMRTAPYGSAGIAEGVRSALGFATLPFELNIILMDEAVWAFLPNQQPEGIGGNPTWSLFETLTDIDVTLNADSEAINERGLAVQSDMPKFNILNSDEISALIGQADAVLTY